MESTITNYVQDLLDLLPEQMESRNTLDPKNTMRMVQQKGAKLDQRLKDYTQINGVNYEETFSQQ